MPVGFWLCLFIIKLYPQKDIFKLKNLSYNKSNVIR